jgi:beta-lactamase regulating signal transducer with metallopeptidase domain
MNELHALQDVLIAATAVFSGSVLVLALARRWLRRQGGVLCVYAAWLALPLALLTLALPTLRMPQPVAQIVVPLLVSEPPSGFGAGRSLQRQGAPLALQIWALGALGLSGLLLGSQWRCRRRLRRFGPHWRGPAGGALALLGAWPPRLVLPGDFRQRHDRAERRLMLAHERVHARRGDNHWTLLAWCLLVLQWFNPLAWWALRRYRMDQELACDAAVLAQHGDLRRVYRAALLKAAGLPGLLLASPCSSHPLIERIAMLSQPHRPLRRGLVALLVLALAGGGYLAQAQPRSQGIEPGQVRVLMDLQVNGEFLQPIVHMAPVGEERSYTVTGGGGRSYELRTEAATTPEGLLRVKLRVIDTLSGKVLGSPQLIGKSGASMRIEMLDPETKLALLGVDIVARAGAALARR